MSAERSIDTVLGKVVIVDVAMFVVSLLSEARPNFDSTDNWSTIADVADVDAEADCLIRLSNVEDIFIVAAVVGIEVFDADCN